MDVGASRSDGGDVTPNAAIDAIGGHVYGWPSMGIYGDLQRAITSKQLLRKGFESVTVESEVFGRSL